jgi:hypothetical protein
MGPQAAKSYPGRRLVRPAGPEAERARQEIDYGRRGVAGYVFGALQPATAQPSRSTYERRTTGNWVDFLGAVESLGRPGGRAGLRGARQPQRPQRSRRAAVRAAPSALGVRVPAHVCRLPQPDRALVEDPALPGPEGRRFEAWAEIERAVERATAYWNEHKHAFVWGRRRRHRQPRRLGIATVPKLILI